MYNMVSVIQVFDEVTVPPSGSALSKEFDMSLSNGECSLQVHVSGNGTLKVEKLLSNDGDTFLEPDSASDIFASLTKTSGPDSNGKAIKGFTAEPAGFLKIKLVETGGNDSVTVSGWLAVR